VGLVRLAGVAAGKRVAVDGDSGQPLGRAAPRRRARPAQGVRPRLRRALLPRRGRRRGTPGSMQYRWLRRDLAGVDCTRTTSFVVALVHVPWYSSNVAPRGEADAMHAAMEDLQYMNLNHSYQTLKYF
jgi:hypothetical protein